MAAKRIPTIVKKIIAEATDVHAKIRRKSKPQMKLPIRSLSNVKYHPRNGYFQLKGRYKT
ncbi:hypothetical protein LCGC14_2839930, partial [marine sediment metagenome]